MCPSAKFRDFESFWRTLETKPVKQTVDIGLGLILVKQKIPHCKQTADGLL